MKKTAAELFWPKVDVGWTHDCWEWTASVLPNGYGQFSSGKNRGTSILPHRVSYEFLVGPVGDDMTIDHLCKNKVCVNPQHLEVVTIQENIKRRDENGYTRNINPWNLRKTHCPRGHAYDVVTSSGGRGCRKCSNEQAKLYQRRKRAVS